MHLLFCRRRNFRGLITIAAFILAGTSAPLVAAVGDLRVMSFNVRTGSANDGNDSWNHPADGPDRKDYVVTTIKNYGPDILGLQEDLEYQGNYIDNQTTGYDMFRRGVHADGSGEQVAILYRRSRFTKLREGTFWLSPTPNQPGSAYADAEFPRIVNWLELSDGQNAGFTFVVMNTHWEHGGADAKDAVRLNSAALMRRRMGQIAPGLPMIFTGDFNADEGSDPYRRMAGRDDFVEQPVDEERFLTDTYRNRHADSETVGTAHGFDGRAGTGRIDWILHDDASFDTIEANIDRTSFTDPATGNKRYPSDHFPINAVIRPVPEPASAIVLVFATLVLARRRRSVLRP